jgi:pimeloyl-ACP methyl ester carboxylesterase
VRTLALDAKVSPRSHLGCARRSRSHGLRRARRRACERGCRVRPLAWKTLPCWYLLGTEDKAIPPALQRFMAERANATIVEVPASHVSFVSQPEAATQLIVEAVEMTTLSRT